MGYPQLVPTYGAEEESSSGMFSLEEPGAKMRGNKQKSLESHALEFHWPVPVCSQWIGSSIERRLMPGTHGDGEETSVRNVFPGGTWSEKKTKQTKD